MSTHDHGPNRRCMWCCPDDEFDRVPLDVKRDIGYRIDWEPPEAIVFDVPPLETP